MKSSQEILEEAIIQNPNDPATFAAYADLLIEKGNPQGEFIQVQLALENETLDPQERKKLQLREQELLRANERTWLGALAPLYLDQEGINDWQKAHFNRFYSYYFNREVLAELFCGSFDTNCAQALVTSPHETRFLHTLQIENIEYEQPEETAEVEKDLPEEIREYHSLRLLAKWKNLPHLRHFQFGQLEEGKYLNCHIQGEDIHHLVKQMPWIEELRLYAHRINMKELFAFSMPSLRILDLAHTHLFPLEVLAENKSLAKLEHLLIYPHAIENGELPYQLTDLRAICRSPYLMNLTHLRMRTSLMGDQAIEEIVSSGLIKRLRYLDLAGGRVSDQGAELLVSCPETKNLQTLNLNSNELTQEGIRKLETLNIFNLDVQDQHESTFDADEDDLWDLDFLYYGDFE